MSSVMGLVLVCSVDEDEAPERFVAWVAARDSLHRPPLDVSNGAGGDKHPEVMILAAGLNYAGDPREYLVQFHLCPWRWPGLATLILTPDGCERAIVARAADAAVRVRAARDEDCPSCRHTECSCGCAVCEAASRTEREPCPCPPCTRHRADAAIRKRSMAERLRR